MQLKLYFRDEAGEPNGTLRHTAPLSFRVALSNRRYRMSFNNWGVQRVLPKKDSFASPSLVNDGGVP